MMAAKAESTGSPGPAGAETPVAPELETCGGIGASIRAGSRALGTGLEALAGCVLVAALVAAPWMYGGTRHWAMIRLCEMLSSASGLWLGGLALQGRQMRIPMPAGLCVLFLFVAGWLVVLFGKPLPSDAFVTAHFAELVARYPGSMFVKTQRESMWLYTGLLGAMLAGADLGTKMFWRRAFFITMAVAGASISLLGFAQIRSGTESILWNADVPFSGYFFATFFHHTSAGAFLNLTWPLATALTLRGFWSPGVSRKMRLPETICWSLTGLMILCGLPALISKLAQVIGGLMLIAFGIWLSWRLPRVSIGRMLLGGSIASLLIGALVVIVIVQSGKAAQLAEHWQVLFNTATSDPSAPTVNGFQMRSDLFIQSSDESGFLSGRRQAITTCLKIIPQAGFLGFGPGSWTQVYPHFTEDAFLRTFFLHMQFAHADYLQTIVEWGVLGALAWGFLVFRAVWKGLLSLRNARRKGGVIEWDEAITLGALFALGGILLHALIDFPLQIPANQLYFCILVGLLWTRALEPQAGKSE